jgi:glycogen debranching enzyme
MKKIALFLFLFLLISLNLLNGQDGTISSFELESHELTLSRLAKPGTPFIKAGRKFAILGNESGSFEAWAYPLKLIRNFQISFLIGSSTTPIQAKDIVHSISVQPGFTTLTFTYQSFTVKAVYFAPVDEPGAVILLSIDSIQPLTVICGFLPVLQPMWPAGLGGQRSSWSSEHKAYIISEPTRKNHGIIGSPAASGLSYTPAHMLSDLPQEFKIEVPQPEEVSDKFIPIYIAGGKATQEEIINIYYELGNNPEELYRENRDHYRNLQKNTLRIITPDKKMNLAYEWAKVAFDYLVVDNPDLGKGLVAGLGASGSSGRPGFGWFFGGDAFINIFSLLSSGSHKLARDILAFNQKWQRDDGKMAHELSQAADYIDWWNDYPYGFIHGDTTPFYIAAMYEYLKASGDKDFIKESWDSIQKAYEWCISTDENKDGLMDNKKAGLGAMEYGSLIGIETDIYLAAVWTRAAFAMTRLAEAVGKKDMSGKTADHYKKAMSAFDKKFWDENNDFYAYAFNSGGDLVDEISPWSAVGSIWDLGSANHNLRTLERLCRPDLETDWGIRSISDQSQYYEPLNYNYGAVWPFVTGWVTTARYKNHMPLQGYTLLRATALHTFEHALGSIPEVLSGSQYIWIQEAVTHQGFSTAGFVLPFIRGLVGLDGDAQEKTVTFSPQFPADWKDVAIENFKIGDAVFSFEYRKSQYTLEVKIQPKNASGYTIQFSPCFADGTRFLEIGVNGSPISFRTDRSAQNAFPIAEIPVQDKDIRIEMDFIPTLEILPAISPARVGEGNKGLKLISTRQENSQLIIDLEGLSGQNYKIGLQNGENIKEVNGADYKENELRFQIPAGTKKEYVPYKIKILMKD